MQIINNINAGIVHALRPEGQGDTSCAVPAFLFMKGIELSNGLRTAVDDENFHELNKYDWFAKRSRGRFYAYRKEKGKSVIMHRVVMGEVVSNVLIDHKDGNGLNNQKSNLRRATHSQNMVNRITDRTNLTSKYLGVYLNKATGKWISAVRKDRKRYNLGVFESEEAAALAYNKKAFELHGDFAKINVIK